MKTRAGKGLRVFKDKFKKQREPSNGFPCLLVFSLGRQKGLPTCFVRSRNDWVPLVAPPCLSGRGCRQRQLALSLVTCRCDSFTQSVCTGPLVGSTRL